MVLRGLRSAQFRVEDMTGAKEWYANLFDIEPYFDEPFYVGFEVMGYEFGLMPGEASEHGALFLWATEDPKGFIDRAVALGATEKMEPQDTGDGIVVGTFIDPFGNEFGVIRNPHFAPALTYASADDTSSRTITIEVEVGVSPMEAWHLWASSEGLAKWWTENTRVEMRPGGHYEIYFNPEEKPGDKGGDWCRVLSFLPGRMLTFTWNAPPNFDTRPLHTWVVLLFQPTNGGTKVQLNHHGWPESGLSDHNTDWPETYEYFESAWRYVMDLFEGQFSAA